MSNAKILAKCPICKNTQVSAIGLPEISSKAAEFITTSCCVMRCKTCCFYFLFPDNAMSKQGWETLYADNYFLEMPYCWAKQRAFQREQRLNCLQKYLPRKIERFLDIGCGQGHTMLAALQRGWDTYGVDITDNRIEPAKDAAIKFFKGDILQKSFPDNFFDCIYLDSVLEHLADPMRYLTEIKRILRKDGVFYIGVPNEDCLYNDVKKAVYVLMGRPKIAGRLTPFKSPYHVSGFTKNSLTKALNSSGFKIIKLRNFAGEDEWMKFKPFTKPFLIHFLLLPVHLAAIPLNKRLYFEAVARKD